MHNIYPLYIVTTFLLHTISLYNTPIIREKPRAPYSKPRAVTRLLPTVSAVAESRNIKEQICSTEFTATYIAVKTCVFPCCAVC
jgi:hypothetical protein